MKKVLGLVLVLMTISLSNFGQEKLSTYRSSYDNETYDISVNIENKDLYIDAMSLDTHTGGFLIDDKNRSNFIETLDSVKVIFEKWSNTAKTNNIAELVKTIPLSCEVDNYFNYGGWCFDFNNNMTIDFKVLEVNKYILILRSGNLVSSSNEYIKTKGVVLVFTDPKEIDIFIKAISNESILAKIKSKENSAELFN